MLQKNSRKNDTQPLIFTVLYYGAPWRKILIYWCESGKLDHKRKNIGFKTGRCIVELIIFKSSVYKCSKNSLNWPKVHEDNAWNSLCHYFGQCLFNLPERWIERNSLCLYWGVWCGKWKQKSVCNDWDKPKEAMTAPEYKTITHNYPYILRNRVVFEEELAITEPWLRF